MCATRSKIAVLAALATLAGLWAITGFREVGRESGRRLTLLQEKTYTFSPREYTVLPPPRQEPVRRIYPYSVIPGGVRDRSELTRAVLEDRVVAAHFADFHVTDSHVVELRAEKLVHVSYRINENIYWTKEPVRLPKGEKLITDGQEFARARCGNRVSVMAQEPTLEAEEPPLEALEIPIMEEPELMPIPEELYIEPLEAVDLPIIPRDPSLLKWIAPVISGAGGFMQGRVSELPPQVPEPNSLVLLVLGLAVGGFGLRRLRR